jgi:hypothetical protein
MAINFPSSLDTLSNPTGSDLLENATSALDHDVQHSNANDAIEALEAKVGANSSAVTTSHDYKLSGVTGSDKAASKTGTETLTNKTLTAPQINMGSDATGDMYYRTSGGAFARLPIGTSGQILQTSASAIPEWIANPAVSDASTTVKGVVEEATQAEVLARTTSGGTSARLFVNPSTLTTVQTYDYAASSGGTDTYAITVTPAPTAYVTGQTFRFKADVANTGPCTINVNGLGAKSIYKNVSSELDTGDIAAGEVVTIIYDVTNFQLQGKSVTVADLSQLAGVGSATRVKTYWNFDIPFLISTDVPTGNYWVVTNATITNFASNSIYLAASSDATTSIITNTTGNDSGIFLMPGTLGPAPITFATTKDVIVEFGLELNATGTEQIGFGLASSNAPFIDYDDATERAACFTVSAAGALYGHTSPGGGGANHTETLISGVTLTDFNTYRIEFNPGVDVKFYVNGVLKATNTTNLPTSDRIRFGYGVQGSTNSNDVVQMTKPYFAIEK